MRHVLLVGTSVKVFIFVLLAEDGNANRMSDLWWGEMEMMVKNQSESLDLVGCITVLYMTQYWNPG